MKPSSDLESRLRQRLEGTPVAATLGVVLTSIGEGSAELRLPHRVELSNGNGVIHGGILAALADSAVAFALATLFDGKMGFATSDLTIHYLRRARTDVLARARIVRCGATIALGEAELVDPAGTLLAKVLASFVLTTVRIDSPKSAAPLPPSEAPARPVRRRAPRAAVVRPKAAVRRRKPERKP